MSHITNKFRFLVASKLIKDVITPLGRQLKRHSRFLQQIFKGKKQN